MPRKKSVAPSVFPRVRRKPAEFTNQHCCFSDEQLFAILRKPDEDLQWSDFRALFPISACAGGYDEQLYFVPVAIEHLAREPMDGREYVSGFIEFFARNAAALERDGLAVPARDAVASLLSRWTSSFRVTHFDQRACEQNGWSLCYLDIVESCEAVRELLELLLGQAFFAETAEGAVRALVAPESSDENVAWFLEIARAVHERSVNFLASVKRRKVPDLETSARRVQDLLTDPAVLQRQFERIRPTVVSREPSPTYWRDVFFAIGLAVG